MFFSTISNISKFLSHWLFSTVPPVKSRIRSTEWYQIDRIDAYFDKIWLSVSTTNSATYQAGQDLISMAFNALVDNPDADNQVRSLARRKKKSQDKKQIIFIYNSGQHYELYVLDRVKKAVYHIDGLNYPINTNLAARIVKYAKIIWPEEKNTLFSIQKITMPHQGNGVDCGPAVCQMAHHILHKGLEDLFQWAKTHEKFDYSVFRNEVDKILGEHIPYVESEIVPPKRTYINLLDSDDVTTSDEELQEITAADFAKIKRQKR